MKKLYVRNIFALLKLLISVVVLGILHPEHFEFYHNLCKGRELLKFRVWYKEVKCETLILNAVDNRTYTEYINCCYHIDILLYCDKQCTSYVIGVHILRNFQFQYYCAGFDKLHQTYGRSFQISKTIGLFHLFVGLQQVIIRIIIRDPCTMLVYFYYDFEIYIRRLAFTDAVCYTLSPI